MPETSVSAMTRRNSILFVSTPMDKALSLSEGSTIWIIRGMNIGEQVDELVREGRVSDAIGLVEAVGEDGLPPVRPSHSHDMN
jgi:hypothetical protein